MSIILGHVGIYIRLIKPRCYFCVLLCGILCLYCLKLDRNELRKLSEESLQRQPEEVFDVLEKLGEG